MLYFFFGRLTENQLGKAFCLFIFAKYILCVFSEVFCILLFLLYIRIFTFFCRFDEQNCCVMLGLAYNSISRVLTVYHELFYIFQEKL